MEINGPPPSFTKPAQLSGAISNWQIGQVLQATVVKQAGPQSLVLQIANQQLQADTPVILPAGQKLELRVSQLGDTPILQARILSQPSQTTSTSQHSGAAHTTVQASQTKALNVAVNTILKQALPKQASMTTLLANLAWLNQSTGTTFPPAVLNVAKQLIKQLPTKESISNAGQLKQNILNSGVFLESKLNKLASDKAAQALSQTNKQLSPTRAGNIGASAVVNPTDKIAQALKRAVTQSLPIPAGKIPASTATKLSSADFKLGLARLLSAIQQTTRTTGNTTPQTPLNPVITQSLPFTPPPLRGHIPQAQPHTNANLAGQTNLPLFLLELGKQVESSLARTQLHQAASVPLSEQAPTNLAFELPVRNNGQIDIFDIILCEEDKQNQEDKDNKQQWGIYIAFDLDGLGPVHAKLKMTDNKVSTTFWAESMDTTKLLNTHLENLRQRYHQAGLESNELCCYPGSPPVSANTNLPHIVLDINA